MCLRNADVFKMKGVVVPNVFSKGSSLSKRRRVTQNFRYIIYFRLLTYFKLQCISMKATILHTTFWDSSWFVIREFKNLMAFPSLPPTGSATKHQYIAKNFRYIRASSISKKGENQYLDCCFTRHGYYIGKTDYCQHGRWRRCSRRLGCWWVIQCLSDSSSHNAGKGKKVPVDSTI